jgi:hypothetical protein
VADHLLRLASGDPSTRMSATMWRRHAEKDDAGTRRKQRIINRRRATRCPRPHRVNANRDNKMRGLKLQADRDMLIGLLLV